MGRARWLGGNLNKISVAGRVLTSLFCIFWHPLHCIHHHLSNGHCQALCICIGSALLFFALIIRCS